MKKSQREFLDSQAVAALMATFLIVVSGLICGVPQAHAQSAVANLSGTVVDQNERSLPALSSRS